MTMYEPVNILKKYNENYKWANDHRRELLKFVGKFVAVDQGRIIASAKNKETLDKKVGNNPSVYIEVVSPEGLIWIL